MASVVICAGLGCGAYRVGPGGLYQPDVATVYVPMIESDSYRRYLGERLTEAVVKEIESRTPYKVVSTPAADSVLTARILTDTKQTIVQRETSEPRDQRLTISVQVSWVNRKGDLIRQTSVELPPELALLSGTAHLVPEVGQSVASQQTVAIRRTAKQIVDMMEAPWGDERQPLYDPSLLAPPPGVPQSIAPFPAPGQPAYPAYPGQQSFSAPSTLPDPGLTPGPYGLPSP